SRYQPCSSFCSVFPPSNVCWSSVVSVMCSCGCCWASSSQIRLGADADRVVVSSSRVVTINLVRNSDPMDFSFDKRNSAMFSRVDSHKTSFGSRRKTTSSWFVTKMPPRTPDHTEIMLKMATGHFGNNFFMSRQWKIACNCLPYPRAGLFVPVTHHAVFEHGFHTRDSCTQIYANQRDIGHSNDQIDI